MEFVNVFVKLHDSLAFEFQSFDIFCLDPLHARGDKIALNGMARKDGSRSSITELY